MMSQRTLTSYYTSRKRAATDDIVNSKIKVPHIDARLELKSKCKESLKAAQKLSDIVRSDTISPLAGLVTKKTNQKNLDKTSSQVKEAPSTNAFAQKVNATNIAKESKPSSSNSVTSARKELNLGDIKKRLLKSNRLSELKERAQLISKGIQQLQDPASPSSKKTLKEFRSINVEVPISPSKKKSHPEFLTPKKNEPVEKDVLMSPRKVPVSPIKSPVKVSEYLKHTTAAPGLPLPYRYRTLAELFRAMETVVSLMYNRKEKITFGKLKPSIQEMLKRNFTERHLGQIKNLVPDFYNFEVQKCKSFSESSKSDNYDMVITPTIPNEIKEMNPSVLIERRRYFHDTLIQLTKKYHSQFLLTLDPPMSIPDDKLLRWHAEFELEKTPEVECAKLPEIPSNQKLSSAQDVLAKARELFKCNSKMERALQKLADAKNRGLTDKEKVATGLQDNNSDGPKTSTSNIEILNPALRKLPTALLDMVKAKQAAKALVAMTRSTEDENMYQMYSRLPELAKTLRNIYVTERKNVLALNMVLSKLDNTFKGRVSATRLHDDIKVLCDKVPDWIKLQIVRGTTYVKLDKSAKIQDVLAKLEQFIEKYRP